MKKARLHLLLVATFAAIAFPAVAGAAPGNDKHKVSGNWVDCNFAPLVRQAGPPMVVIVGITQDFTGTLDGTYTGSERDVIPDVGPITFQGGGMFTGSVAGRYGTASFRYEGTVPLNGAPQATWVLEGPTESLERVKGHGTFDVNDFASDPSCPGGVYSGTYTGTLK